MAEELLPTIVPGMVGLKNKKTGKTTNHFPVDAREILSIGAGDYELVENGAVQVARINANPLHEIQNRNTVMTEVTGIEGQVMVAMSPEDAEKWRAEQDKAKNAGEKPAETAETKETEKPKETAKTPTPAATK